MFHIESLERFREIVLLSCMAIILFATILIPGITSMPANAQPIDFTKNFAVFMTLFGLNDTTGQIFAFVNVHGMTKSALVNGSQLFIANNQTGGIAQIPIVFQNLTLKVAEPYTACIVALNQAKMICTTDYKTPYPRAQILDISVR